MELILKQYDIPLLRFSATNDSNTPEIEVHWINEDQRHLLPLDMELSPEGISRWMRRRTIPRNRAYVNRLLAKCGLNANRPMGILALCKGLSVDDSYWVVEEGFEGTFEKYNLFKNRFSEVLALIAFYRLRKQQPLVAGFQPGIHDKRHVTQVLAQNQRKSHAVQGRHRRRLQHGRRAILRILRRAGRRRHGD